MDGENNGSKPYEQMDDLGVPLFLETPKYALRIQHNSKIHQSYVSTQLLQVVFPRGKKT